MSESESVGAGRSRGRARGRPVAVAETGPTAGAEGGGAAEGGGNGGNGGGNGGNGGNGDGNGGASRRGRGGFRGTETINTIPPTVKITHGEGGQQVRVVANYFRLHTPKDVIIYDYHVDFEPQVEARVMRKALLFTHKEAFNNKLTFDGMSNIKSTTKLATEETEFFSTRRTDDAQIRIKVKMVGEIAWGHQEMLRMYNIQMRRNLHLLKWNLIGRHYFNPDISHKIPEHKLEVLQGVLTAINQHDDGLLLVTDTVHKVLRMDTVAENLRDILNRDRSSFQDNARKELAGNIVMTTYNNKTYKVDDLAFDKNPTTLFKFKTNEMPIHEYYKQHYNIEIRDLRQPLIVGLPTERQQRAGTEGPIYLIPELCRMTGLSETLRSDFNVRRSMTQKTQTDPTTRVKNLHQFISRIANDATIQQEMNQWGLKFESVPVEINARRLDCEKILMQGDTPQTGATFIQKTGDFSKEIRNKSMFGGCRVQDWVIIATQRDRQLVDEFSQTLNRVCRPLGIQLNRPQVQHLENDRIPTYVEACKALEPKTQIAVILLPNNSKDRYDAIKKIFCIDHPIPSQCVVTKTLSKKQMLMSVCTKVGIQMGAKLGGEPWALDIPPKDLMVAGFDVHRDQASRGKAIGGFVCSTNATLTKWYSRVAFHDNREELSSNLATNFSNGLKRYYEINKKLPQRLIIYRDGVGEGDIQYVYEYELKQIEEAIQKIGSAAAGIKLAFVIVTKRINTRIMQKLGERQFDNPFPGTIVDTCVTRKERYDFYLISQSVRQGTVAPTMYNIIKDDTNWKPHHHQQLAYKLTHLYYNWVGTIRVPAPCQYAHKLAFLTGTALHREPNVALSDSLFYL
ncbi:piwi-like protein 1 [Oppia nitens]|uniref:piwi-like protein 1 n=1 Tax=Oppia nitens TaxID=1686743 RepID=UPI0023DA5DB8|nr:piwi-like protein 1 [Oppia nitens]XP_054155823.1 piwi-like protein 1 [Oppia nitens]